MRNVITFIAAISLAGLAACSGPRMSADEKAGVQAAEEWLATVDGGGYADSWDQAAEYFRGRVSKENWAQLVEAARKPLGERKTRMVVETEYTTSLPGGPDGEYVIITFETSFENKQSAIETIVPSREADGSWHVAAYYIK